MRIIYIIFTLLLISCSGSRSEDVKVSFDRSGYFVVQFSEIFDKYCISDLFINPVNISDGQAIEIIDETGRTPMFNMGYFTEPIKSEYQRIKVGEHRYKVSNNYILEKGHRYKYRLNVYAFDCKLAPKEYIFYSYVHGQLYGNVLGGGRQIKSEWKSLIF